MTFLGFLSHSAQALFGRLRLNLSQGRLLKSEHDVESVARVMGKNASPVNIDKVAVP